MPIPTYYKEIIGAIQTATDEGRVNWMREEDNIMVAMPEAFLSLSWGIDAFRHKRFVAFGLKDLRNKARDGWSVDEGDEDYDTMHALMMAGRKAASGVGPRLDEIKDIFLHSASIGKEDTERKKRNELYGT